MKSRWWRGKNGHLWEINRVEIETEIETETEAAADGFRLRSVLSFGQKVLTQQIFQGPLADGNTDDDIDD